MRDLIFFGYQGAPGNDGVTEPDFTNLMVALTLRRHILKRFPTDQVEIVCAWHKNTFVRSLMTPPSSTAHGRIRQLHYVGHGAPGGLYFGYHNKIAVKARDLLDIKLRSWPMSGFPHAIKRKYVLWNDAGLMSGFFDLLRSEAGIMSGFYDILPTSKLGAIKAQLAPKALMQIWGCFAGAPTHIFDPDPYWNLLNPVGGRPVDGIARHIARALGITVTAIHDPVMKIHGADPWYRDQHGKFHTGEQKKLPDRLPQWSWPTNTARWITYDPSGTWNEKQINFLGRSEPSSRLPSGKPPKWFTDEMPRSLAAREQPGATCSAEPVAI